MTTFNLQIRESDGKTTPVAVAPARVYNLGSATVDATKAVAHQTEVANAGVRIPFDIPAPRVYPMSVPSITTDSVVGVHHGQTSGEAELVLVVVNGEIYLGLGSDHTDRVLETISIIWSKQYAPSVLGTSLWRWADVEGDWEQLQLESTVDGRLYQCSPAAVFRTPPEIIDALSERVTALPSTYLVYCGTYTTISNTIEFGTKWTARLANLSTDQTLNLDYTVVDLLEEIRPGYRVPLRPKET